MKRFLFLIAAAVAMATTAAPSQAAFMLTVEQGTYNSVTGVFTPIGTLFSSNASSGGDNNLIGPDNTIPNLSLGYNFASTSTSLSTVAPTNLFVNFNPGLGSTETITLRIVATETAITLPGTPGETLDYTGSFSFSAGGATGSDGGINLTSTLSQGGSDLAVLKAGTPPPSGNGLIPITASGLLIGDTVSFFRPAGSSATITDTAIISLTGQVNFNLAGGSFVAVNPVPVPATALMGLFTLPVVGLAARFRRGTAIPV